jgi:Secretion system C-terminal sorting domain
MRRFYTILFAVTIFFGKAQNADLTFDQAWVLGALYPASEPVGWVSSNVLTSGLISFPNNPTTVIKSTSFFNSLPNSAQIITKKVIPGILSSAGFNDTSGFMISGKLVTAPALNIVLGYSYAVKSAQLDFQYNYQPTSLVDRGLVSVVFLKRNGAARDTIATGYTILTGSPSTTAFQTGSVLINYRNINGSAPDTAIIGAASSVGSIKNLLGSLSILAPAASLNSTLYLDDLSFSGIVSGVKTISEEKSLSVNFNNNSETLDVNVSSNYIGFTKIKIYDVTGKMIASKNITANAHKLDVKELQTGLYLYSVTDKADKNLKSGKMVISK